MDLLPALTLQLWRAKQARKETERKNGDLQDDDDDDDDCSLDWIG